VINQVECTEPSPVNHTVTQEVHTPALIYLFLPYQRLFNPAGQSMLSYAFSIQLQEFMHPIDLFMVALFAESSDIGKEFAESIGRVFKSQILQCFNNCFVILLRLVVVHFTR
jgi:hypothetical protein